MGAEDLPDTDSDEETEDEEEEEENGARADGRRDEAGDARHAARETLGLRCVLSRSRQLISDRITMGQII